MLLMMMTMATATSVQTLTEALPADKSSHWLPSSRSPPSKLLLLPAERGNPQHLIFTSTTTESVHAQSPPTLLRESSDPSLLVLHGPPTSKTWLHEHQTTSAGTCSHSVRKGLVLPDPSAFSDCEANYSRSIASFFRSDPLPSMESIIALVLSNRKLKRLEYSKVLYAHLCGFGLEHDTTIGNHLVPLFVACGGVSDAHKVFCKLYQPNEYSWSSLAQGYVDSGALHLAISLYQDQHVVMSNFMLTSMLKACAELKCMQKGREVFMDIVKQGIEGDLFVGNSLLDMYISCGCLMEAWEIFERLPVRDVVSWTALISGCVEHGLSEEAIVYFELMQSESVIPNIVTHMCTLNACANLADIQIGHDIHARVVKTGSDAMLQVGNALIDMYFKFASTEEAVKVFNNISSPDVVSWTSLITGYVDHSHYDQALFTFRRMEVEGISPNAVTFSSVLKACRGMKNAKEGYMIHMRIVKSGWDSNLYVGTTLLDMYAECGALADALDVFEKLEARSTVSWNTLISAFSESGFGEEALKHFTQMQVDGIPQDAVTFLFGLKACANTGAFDKGQEIHYEIAKESFEKDTFVGSMLVDMYAKGGFLDEAWEVFEQMDAKDVVAWTAFIGGCIEWGSYEMAFDSFKRMQVGAVSPNAVTYILLLKACGTMKNVVKGIELHVGITKQGLDIDSLVYKALIDMYCRCGKVSEAQALFDALPHEDVDTWNILIGGYADHGLAEDALKSLDLMQAENVPLNAVTYVCVLKAISTVRNLDKGQEIHVIIVEEEFDKDLFVGNSLIDMYAKCGSLGEAQEVFDELLCRDIVSWNALIAGYIDHGFVEKGIECFAQLQTEKNIFPNAVTYVAILKACGNQRDMEKGYKFHSEIVQAGFEEESFVGTSLMRMYASLGCFLEVQEVFYDLPDRDVISWTALVAGCGPGEDTIKYLEQMQEDGVPPNVVTYVCSLKCCGGVGADRRIRQLLSDILKRGFEMDTSVAYNLVEAYVKYGSIAEARNIFNKLQVEDEEFWIATVAAYAELGINGSAPYVSDHSLIAA